MNKIIDNIFIFILLLIFAIAFYAGTTVNDPQFKLMNFLTGFVQIISGIATVLAVIYAAKSYRNWINQITHPHQFDKDLELNELLDEIHNRVYGFALFYGAEIEHIYSEYHKAYQNGDDNEMDKLSKQKEEIMEDFSKRFINFDDECDDIRDYFFCKVYSASKAPFSTNHPEVMKMYLTALSRYYYNARLLCKTSLSHETTKDLPLIFINGGSRVLKFDDASEIGDSFLKLDSAFKEVKKYYSQKWS